MMSHFDDDVGYAIDRIQFHLIDGVPKFFRRNLIDPLPVMEVLLGEGIAYAAINAARKDLKIRKRAVDYKMYWEIPDEIVEWANERIQA